MRQVEDGDPPEIREAFDIILGLLRYIDECHDDIIFFADEAGAWQVGVDWATVFPAWFTCLSRTSKAAEYASRVLETVNEHDAVNGEKHLAAALRIATPSQRKALEAATPRAR